MFPFEINGIGLFCVSMFVTCYLFYLASLNLQQTFLAQSQYWITKSSWYLGGLASSSCSFSSSLTWLSTNSSYSCTENRGKNQVSTRYIQALQLVDSETKSHRKQWSSPPPNCSTNGPWPYFEKVIRSEMWTAAKLVVQIFTVELGSEIQFKWTEVDTMS